MAGQIVKLTSNVSVGSNQAISHSLVRTPTIHCLGVGTGANIVKGNSPSSVSAFYNNTGGGSQAVVALLMAVHSIASNFIALLEGSSSGAGSFTVAHGLLGTPTVLFACFGTASGITANAITADATNVTMNAGGAGQAYSILAVFLHSLWGTLQWTNILAGTMPGATTPTQVSANAVNQSYAHGLQRAPGVVLLGARTGSGISVGSSSVTAANVFFSSTNGALQNLEALCLTGHSIIS